MRGPCNYCDRWDDLTNGLCSNCNDAPAPMPQDIIDDIKGKNEQHCFLCGSTIHLAVTTDDRVVCAACIELGNEEEFEIDCFINTNGGK